MIRKRFNIISLKEKDKTISFRLKFLIASLSLTIFSGALIGTIWISSIGSMMNAGETEGWINAFTSYIVGRNNIGDGIHKVTKESIDEINTQIEVYNRRIELMKSFIEDTKDGKMNLNEAYKYMHKFDDLVDFENDKTPRKTLQNVKTTTAIAMGILILIVFVLLLFSQGIIKNRLMLSKKK
jgi:hypothetical protein